jgi:hypothetical protein
MFTNGNIIVQASRICSRFYSKFRNLIQDVCLNFKMTTPGGESNWINDADDGSVVYDRQVKENIDDVEPSFVEKIGSKGSIYNRTVQDPDDAEEMFSEQINSDGSAACRFVSGLHEINIDENKVEIKALSGEHTITLDVSGVHIVTSANFDVTAAKGTLEVNELGGNWSVIGDLVLASTGNMYLQPVGNLYLPG